MNKSDVIKLREVRPTDIPFIYRSILLGVYHGNKYKKGSQVDPGAPTDFFSAIDQDTFMGGYHTYLDLLFSRPGVEVRIACDPLDEDLVRGFSVYQEGILHFVFVRPQWRRLGIATDLVPKQVSCVTGFTKVGDVIRRKKGWKFNPWG